MNVRWASCTKVLGCHRMQSPWANCSEAYQRPSRIFPQRIGRNLGAEKGAPRAVFKGGLWLNGSGKKT